MFVRFVIDEIDEDSGYRKGLFQAMDHLADNERLDIHEQSVYDEVYAWFLDNLKEPLRLSRSKKYYAKKVALSWFKSSSKRHIDRMRDLQAILHSHGIQTIMLRTERPGYVVYEDRHQIAAEPFAETEA